MDTFWALTLKILILLLLVIVGQHLLSIYNTRKWERKLGAKPLCNVEPAGLFGFRSGLKQLYYMRMGLLTDFQRTRYDLLPSPKLNLFLMKLFGKTFILTRDPENIKALLATQFNEFSLGDRRLLLYAFLGDGIFTADGESWSHSRAMLRPLFTRGQIGRLSALEPHVKLLLDHVRRHQGQPFDMQDLILRFTVDSSTMLLFGESAKSLEEDTSEKKAGTELFEVAFNEVLQVIATQLLMQGMKYLSYGRGFIRSLDTVNEFANSYIKKTLEMPIDALKGADDKDYVFLHSLCQHTRDPKVLRDELLNTLLAGRDTTAALLAFAIYELARNQEMWNALKQEVNKEFGQGLDGITFESLKQCKYLRGVLNELLRMYPPIPINGRTARKTTTLPRGGGPDGSSPILVKGGQTVAYSVYAMHRNPEIYGNDANIFDPSRWLDGRTKALGWAYLPFNGGPRVCLGQQYALTEASYVMVRLAQTFDNLTPAVADTIYPPRILSRITISLADGLKICMQ